MKRLFFPAQPTYSAKKYGQGTRIYVNPHNVEILITPMTQGTNSPRQARGRPSGRNRGSARPTPAPAPRRFVSSRPRSYQHSATPSLQEESNADHFTFSTYLYFLYFSENSVSTRWPASLNY